MIIQSTRVGSVELEEQDLIHFSTGVVGLPDWQDAVMVPVPDVPILTWLQFAHDPDAAFLLLDIQSLYPYYDCDLARQQVGAGPTATVYTIVKVPNGDFSKATTNLMGPIVIQGDKRLGTQVILHDSNYPLRHPLFEGEAAC